jgi:uncharacterized membrane protein YgaE (UPF0421/DUF939 family)
MQLAVRASVAAGASLALAQYFELQYPLYAMIAAVIVTDLSRAETSRLGLRRLGATVIGATCGASMSRLLPPSPWGIAFSIFLAMLICHIVRAPEGAKVAGYTSSIVVLTHGADPFVYGFWRFVETGLGITVAWLVSLTPKLLAAEEGDTSP